MLAEMHQSVGHVCCPTASKLLPCRVQDAARCLGTDAIDGPVHIPVHHQVADNDESLGFQTQECGVEIHFTPSRESSGIPNAHCATPVPEATSRPTHPCQPTSHPTPYHRSRPSHPWCATGTPSESPTRRVPHTRALTCP